MIGARAGIASVPRLAWAVVALAVAVTSWPYLEAAWRTPSGHAFLGLVGPYANDQAFYLGWGPRQAFDGHLLFEDKFNGHAERRAVFNPLWLAMGGLARLTGLPLIATFHLARVAGGVLLLLAALAWFRRAGLSPGWQTWALAMLAFGSGLGAYAVPLARWGDGSGFSTLGVERITPDLWVVESNVFLTLLGECVLPAATALLLWSLRAGLDALDGSPRDAAWAGARVLLLGTVYPYGVISAWSILAALALWRMLSAKQPGSVALRWASLVAVSAPIVAYDYWLVWSDPRLTVGQALYASPSPAAYAMGFGVFTALALAGAAVAWRSRLDSRRALVVWAAANLGQAYLPIDWIPFQLQLVLGLPVPLVALSALTVARLLEPLRDAARRAGAIALALLSLAACGTSAFHWLDARAGAGRGRLPEYVTTDVMAALRFLDVRASDEDVVLAAPAISPFVALVAGTRMFTADYQAPTADYPRKAALVRSLAAPSGLHHAEALLQALRNERVAWLLCDGELRRLGDAGLERRLDRMPGLHLAFANGGARVYQVLAREAIQAQPAAASTDAQSPADSPGGW